MTEKLTAQMAVAVKRALKAAIERIGEVHELLSEVLKDQKSVKTALDTANLGPLLTVHKESDG